MRKAQDIDVPIDVIGIKNKKGESVYKQPTADERERAILKKENDESTKNRLEKIQPTVKNCAMY